MKLSDEERVTRKSCACGKLLRKDNSDGVCKDCRKKAKKEEAANRAASPKRGRPRRVATPPHGTAGGPLVRINGRVFHEGFRGWRYFNLGEYRQTPESKVRL
jgi:hypothetical protein